MTARNLLESGAFRLEAEQTRVRGTARHQPIAQVAGRLVRTIGTLHLYELTLPQGSSIEQETSFSIIFQEDMEPTEGIVLGGQDNAARGEDAVGIRIKFSGNKLRLCRYAEREECLNALKIANPAIIVETD